MSDGFPSVAYASRSGRGPYPTSTPLSDSPSFWKSSIFLCKRVAVDAQPRGRLYLRPAALLQHLLDQLALDAADDALVQLAVRQGLDAETHQLLDQAGSVAAVLALSGRHGRSTRPGGASRSERSGPPSASTTARAM